MNVLTNILNLQIVDCFRKVLCFLHIVVLC